LCLIYFYSLKKFEFFYVSDFSLIPVLQFSGKKDV
jgi:hypothetical protein